MESVNEQTSKYSNMYLCFKYFVLEKGN